MTLLEFTKLVVPTGLLSAEESLSVYSYLSGDEATRSLDLLITAGILFCYIALAIAAAFIQYVFVVCRASLKINLL